MWFIFDNLRALLISGVVLMMLVTLMLRTQELGVEQISIYSAKTHSLDLAEWLEEDISTLGSNFDSTTVRFTLPEQEAGNTVDFSFRRDSIGPAPTFATIRVETKYQLIETDTAELPDTTIQMYQIVRTQRVDAGGSWTTWQEDGRSSPRIYWFNVDLLDGMGQSVATEAETVFLKMDFSLVAPFPQGRAFLDRLSWGTTIRLRPY